MREPVLHMFERNVEGSLPVDGLLRFTYPDGIHNSETLMIDPSTSDLYVLSKDQSHERIYRLPYPHDEITVAEAVYTGSVYLEHERGVNQQAVAGEISPSGLSVIIKSYDTVYRWTRTSLDEPLFEGPFDVLPYVPEPQGEAIAWAVDESGYFTVSEERDGIETVLYFYPFEE